MSAITFTFSDGEGALCVESLDVSLNENFIKNWTSAVESLKGQREAAFVVPKEAAKAANTWSGISDGVSITGDVTIKLEKMHDQSIALSAEIDQWGARQESHPIMNTGLGIDIRAKLPAPPKQPAGAGADTNVKKSEPMVHLVFEFSIEDENFGEDLPRFAVLRLSLSDFKARLENSKKRCALNGSSAAEPETNLSDLTFLSVLPTTSTALIAFDALPGWKDGDLGHWDSRPVSDLVPNQTIQTWAGHDDRGAPIFQICRFDSDVIWMSMDLQSNGNRTEAYGKTVQELEDLCRVASTETAPAKTPLIDLVFQVVETNVERPTPAAMAVKCDLQQLEQLQTMVKGLQVNDALKTLTLHPRALSSQAGEDLLVLTGRTGASDAIDEQWLEVDIPRNLLSLHARTNDGLTNDEVITCQVDLNHLCMDVEQAHLNGEGMVPVGDMTVTDGLELLQMAEDGRNDTPTDDARPRG